MNVPLSWLAEYVKVPKETKALADKLTNIGHMLDKINKVAGETVIDLELRGNRADMFGLIGVAREVAAVAGSQLKLPPVTPLPQVDKNSPLVNVQPSAVDLVYRYMAVKLQVTVGPSPKWMVDRLTAYGIPSVNNVVDVTNYVMVETSHPLHAFDYGKIKGGQLILRRARDGEKFATIQQGSTLTLSTEDLVISDQSAVQCLSIIGGWASKVTAATTDIILESAVYNPANCRRTARRLKTMTEGGTRHEKHQDPNGVSQALARAVYLLQQTTQAQVEGSTSDYYPKPAKAKTLKFDVAEVTRLTGLSVSPQMAAKILSSLEFKVKGKDITVPTFRTDIEGLADLVEEIVRIYGYGQIPATPISEATPTPSTYPSYTLGERLREVCTHLGLDEVITLSLVKNGEIKLVNPPDPETGYLRSQLTPSLISYAQRLLNLRQPQVAIFEIGKTFSQHKSEYLEHSRLGIAVAGKATTISDLTGVLQTAASLLGVRAMPVEVGETAGIYWAEVDVDKLAPLLPHFANPYSTVSGFPPIIEDVNVRYTGNYATLVSQIKKLSNLITDIQLIDKYEDKLTLRLTYHSDTKQLSSADISPIRTKLEKLN